MLDTGAPAIGRATARVRGLGANVVVLEVDPVRAAQVRSELGPDSLVLEGDASDWPAQLVIRITSIHERFGKLNVLVIDVVHFITRPTPFDRLTDDQIDRIYWANLGHVFIVTRTALPLLRAAGGASIVNITSIEGFRLDSRIAGTTCSRPPSPDSPRSCRRAGSPEGIRVNAVAPATPAATQVPLNRLIHESQRHHIPKWIPLGRFGTPEDIAGCVLFLASPLAAAERQSWP